MTEEDVIELARQSGFALGYGSPSLEKHALFAELAIEHERERIAKRIAQFPFSDTAASFAIWIREGAQ